ncbi:MAG: hydantoinase B/oxoprolinase family protein [Stackebrandtia sp.]
MAERWQFWIDRGGTFTDVVAGDGAGNLTTHKLLSHDPDRYDDAAIAGIRHILGVAADEPIPTEKIAVVKMGTTVATNALLERKGEPTVLVTTAGFADAPRIAYQNRPHLFTRRIVLPELLHSHVIEADERLDASGEVVRPLDEAAVAQRLEQAFSDGYRSVAVSLMHAFRQPAHERRIGEIAVEAGFTQVSLSYEVSPLIKLVSRTDTTVADAYLSPILRRYVDSIAAQLPGVRLQFMRSSGGLTQADMFRGKDAIMSGPAGGIVGMARTAQAAGVDQVIGFDMGGTSTDVSRFDGEFERQFDTQVAGVRLRAPMMSIHTVAAGGGSILHFDGSRYRVGPDSAGADPGPAAYRRGGPLTVTDANVLLGRIQPDYFPRVFGPDGDEPLDAEAVRREFARLTRRIADGRTPEEVAAGYLRIAVSNMAEAIKRISVQRGHDVTEYALSTFGGAGGQHACAVAEALGMSRVLAHPLAGVLSAYGIGLADVAATREVSVERKLDPDTLVEIADAAKELTAEASAELTAQDLAADSLVADARVHLKYAGTDTALPVRLASIPDMIDEFEDSYRRHFSFLMPERDVVAAAVAVEVTSAGESVDERELPETDEPPRPADHVRMFCGEWTEVPLYRREDLRAGQTVAGPAVVAESGATTVVDPGWRARVNSRNHLLLHHVDGTSGRTSADERVDPVMLELFNNLFMSVAEQMGYRLQATANSVNIKERLDFSCAVFDPRGNLISNAPHMPVHLGSMGESIKTVIADSGDDMRAGDSYVLNNPYAGGTHLPDITVVTPVFDAAGREILFYVASRGHHAEIGGVTPGSMPAFSSRIDEEGVLISNQLLARYGRLCETEMTQLLTSANYPSRNPVNNLADLRAQIAANERGVSELRGLVGHFGLDVVHAYMGHVRDNAAQAVRSVITKLRDGSTRYELDDGSIIAVKISVDADSRTAHVDFTGTSTQRPGNSNAPSAVAKAAVLYVFRTLVDDEIPLNAGCLEPLKITIPEDSMLSPRYPAAVVAGNVETSQSIVGALYQALGVQAEGSGTMNNLTFGNSECQYYETVACGSGAGDGFAGVDVVQTHMTNSRLTDPEVLEWRFPVRLESYAIRRGSGGDGAWRGGDGGVRRLRFLVPMTVNLLSGHRVVPPYGMAGGEPGALGGQWVERVDGEIVPVGGRDSVDVGEDDVFVLETPGGGGYGRPAE